jgi:hypothetical protein
MKVSIVVQRESFLKHRGTLLLEGDQGDPYASRRVSVAWRGELILSLVVNREEVRLRSTRPSSLQVRSTALWDVLSLENV